VGRGARFDCGLRIADCGLNNNEPAAGHACVAVNPQSAIRNPQLPRRGPFPPWPVFDEKDEDALLKVLRTGRCP